MLKAVAFLKGVDRLCQTNLHNPSNMCLGPDVHIQKKHLAETTHEEGKQFSLLKQDFCMDMFVYMLYIQISSDPLIY